MYSLSPLSLLPCPPLEQIEAASAAGLDAVGLRLHPTLETDVDVMGDRNLQRAIERRLSQLDLQVLDIEVFRVHPDLDVQALAPTLSYARSLGARLVAFTSALITEYATEHEAMVIRKLREVAELAERYELQPMLEFMAFRGVATLSDAVRVVTEVGHPGLGVNVDALHLHRSGGTPDQLRRVEPSLIRSLQLCDCRERVPSMAELPAESRRDRLYPGEGVIPLGELIKAVPREVPISLEAPCLARQYLSPCERAIELATSLRALVGERR